MNFRFLAAGPKAHEISRPSGQAPTRKGNKHLLDTIVVTQNEAGSLPSVTRSTVHDVLAPNMGGDPS